MNLVTKLVYKRKKTKASIMKKIYTKMIYLAGADIPSDVIVGENVSFCHNCLGSVINNNTIIEDNVRIYQNVTIGVSNPYDGNCNFIIKKGACLSAGAKIIGKKELIVGENTIIGANSVLLESTGDNEIWVGIPAKKIKKEVKKK